MTTKMRRDDDAEDEEKRMYREQARALEEGKNIREWEYKLTCWAANKLIASSYSHNLFQNIIAVTQEVLTLRQQLSESQLTAAEKQKLMEKAAQLAAENVALKAQVQFISIINGGFQ